MDRGRIIYMWSCCFCGHMGMNATTAPTCVGCLYHARCRNCHVETHKVRSGELKMSPERIAGGTVDPSEDNKTLSVLSSEAGPIPLPHQWNSYTISTAIAPEPFQLFPDIPLAEPKSLPTPDPDAELSEISDKSYTSSEFPTPFSGHLTPCSGALEYWEESPGLKHYDVDSDMLLEIFRSPLDTLFQEWLGEVQDDGQGRGKGHPSSSTVSARPSNSHQQHRPKRKRVDNEEDGESDSGPNKLRHVRKRSRKLTPLHKLLACPYFKKDARHHRACCGFGFKKLSYVKSHLYQKHAISIYCPVCQRPFDNVQLRDSHNRERNCEPVENARAPDGITPEQRDWLGRRGPRSLTEEQQWFRMFEFLFPGHPMPHSAYNNTEFSEDVLNFNDYITSPTGLEVLLERVRDNPLWTSEVEAGLREDIEYGLGQFYWRWAPAANDRSDIGQTPAIESPSREPGAASQSPVEDASSAGINSEARLVGNSASPVVEATGTVVDPPDDAEPRLESSLPFADFELEERKVDEGDQMPARQLNHEGVAPILDQAAWAPEGQSGSDYIVYDPLNLALPDDSQYDNAVLDELFNPPEAIESAELWTASLDLLDYEDVSLGGPGLLHADEFLGDLGVNVTGDTTVVFDNQK